MGSLAAGVSIEELRQFVGGLLAARVTAACTAASETTVIVGLLPWSREEGETMGDEAAALSSLKKYKKP